MAKTPVRLTEGQVLVYLLNDDRSITEKLRRLPKFHLILVGHGELTTFGDDFIMNNKNVLSVEFQGLGALQTIGNAFFSWCKSITSVHFVGLNELQAIGYNFFYFSLSLSLTSIKFTGLDKFRVELLKRNLIIR